MFTVFHFLIAWHHLVGRVILQCSVKLHHVNSIFNVVPIISSRGDGRYLFPLLVMSFLLFQMLFLFLTLGSVCLLSLTAVALQSTYLLHQHTDLRAYRHQFSGNQLQLRVCKYRLPIGRLFPSLRLRQVKCLE